MTQVNRDLQTLGDEYGLAGDLGPEEVVSRARLAVATYARDAQDCRLLLDALGLLPGNGTAEEDPSP
ncbi:hypothetical protein ABT095_18405 [Kitasatospora sp. NPDC002227]|uniref:hypothetical protein n=1 Tax=Kitasatospora sp. NPDC002227 TaxID=3154773 RepID=UPI0033258DBE